MPLPPVARLPTPTASAKAPPAFLARRWRDQQRPAPRAVHSEQTVLLAIAAFAEATVPRYSTLHASSAPPTRTANSLLPPTIGDPAPTYVPSQPVFQRRLGCPVPKTSSRYP